MFLQTMKAFSLHPHVSKWFEGQNVGNPYSCYVTLHAVKIEHFDVRENLCIM